MSNEFTELELSTDVSSMEGDEAKETLVDFMEAHQKNQSAYDELSNTLDEKEAEFSEKLEEKEERIEEFKYEYAEEASEYVNIPTDLVAERFSFSEIEKIIEEGAEFSEESEDADGGEDDDPEMITDFADRPEKGQREGGHTGDRQRAESKMAQYGIGGN